MKLLPMAALAACTSICGHALAESTAHASLSDFTIRLIDTRPDDGITPSVTFMNSQGSAEIKVNGDPFSQSQGQGDFGAASVSNIFSNAAAAGDVSGNLWAGNWSFSTSSSLSAVQNKSFSSIEAFSRADPVFSLTPGTVMVISAVGHVDAMVGVTPWPTSELAVADVTMSVDDVGASNFDSRNTIKMRKTLGSNGQYQDTISQDSPMSLIYLNDGIVSKDGHLSILAIAEDEISLSTPVPENGTVLLMLTGLCGLGVSAGRSRRLKFLPVSNFYRAE